MIIGLIQKGASSHCRDASGWMPLHHAAASGHYTVLKTLLQDEPPVPVDAAVVPSMTTSLHLAAQGGHLNCVRELLKLSASTKAATQVGGIPLLPAAPPVRLSACPVPAHFCD